MRWQRHTIKILFLASLFLGMFYRGLGQGSDNQQLNDFIKDSDELVAKRDFEGATALSSKVDANSFSIEDRITYYYQLQKIYAPPNGNNFDSIIHYVNQVLDITTSDSIRIEQLFTLGNLQVFIGDFSGALQNFLKVYDQREHLPIELDSIILLSRLALVSSEATEKVKWLERLNAMADKSNNPKAKTIAYFDQINYYIKKENDLKIVELLPKLISIGNQLKDSVMISNVYKMVAMCYRQEGITNLDSAEYYLKKAVNFVGTRMIVGEEHILNLQLATTYYYKEEYQKAIDIGTEAIRKLEAQGKGRSGVVRQGYNNLGYCAEALGQFVDAEKYFRKELAILRKQDDLRFTMGALQGLVRVLKAQGKTDGISEYYDEILEIKDSLHAQYSLDQVTEAETRLGLTLKNKELENRDLQISQQKKQQRLFLIVIGLLAAIIGGGIWAYWRIQKDKVLISRQKVQVEKSLTEKEFLLKEIHHRVKNNLQIISSLLDKQARTSADQILKDKMQEGKDRIQSMALIHQNLYQTENLSSIDIKKYIHELTQNIAATQQAPDQNIKVSVKSGDIKLNIDESIPLGLILNELLTNAFKHGFKDKKEGIIDIRFEQTSTGRFHLVFMDNGHGLPDDFEMGQTKTLGLSLVNGLVMQLNGELYVSSNMDNTIFTIEF